MLTSRPATLVRLARRGAESGRTHGYSLVATTAGILLLLTALLLPSAVLVELLRPDQRTMSLTLAEHLLLGAHLFRICLGVLGVSLILLVRLSMWDSLPLERRASPQPESGNRGELAILGAILILAFLLRLPGLNTGLWYDEILTYVSYVQAPFGQAITSYDDSSKNQHFLFTVLAHFAFRLFGESPWALRLPAVVLGVASIWALYRFARDVADRWEALLAAALLACSYHHIWFSQNARGYTGLLFFTIMSSWCLVRGLREARLQPWLFYAISIALGMYTHLSMLFIILGQFLICLGLLVAKRRAAAVVGWSGLFLGFGLGGLLTLTLYALVLPQMLFGPALHEVSTVPAWKNPLSSVFELLEGRNSLVLGVLAAAAGLVFGTGLLSYARRDPLVVCLLLLPVAITAAAGLALGHHLWPRYFFFAMGFGVMLVVRGALSVGRWAMELVRLPGREFGLVRLAPSVALLLASATTIPPVYGPKQDYQGTLAFVEEQRQHGDAVVTTGLAAKPFQTLYRVDWEEVDSLAALNAIRARAQRTWIIYTLPLEMQAVHADILESVQRDFSLVRQFEGTVGGGALFVYRSEILVPKLSLAGTPESASGR